MNYKKVKQTELEGLTQKKVKIYYLLQVTLKMTITQIEMSIK